jgi:cyanophycinase
MSQSWGRWSATMALAVLCTACATAAPPAAPVQTTRAGPAAGSLFIAGGGALDADLVTRFVALAGGADARIVVIPTAGVEDTFPAAWPGLRVFRGTGVQAVTVLHTRSRAVADSDSFVAPLRAATAVWLPGGRQWRLTDVYLGTQTEREIHAVLERGGVVGGTSAGASVQASFMVRGAPESNTILMAPGRDRGFSLLRGAAIDQHLTARGRQDDMLQVIARHPDLLGIGLDEGTALVVQGDRAEIAGSGRVAFYNAADRDTLAYYFLADGGVFDLAARATAVGERITPQTVRDEAAVIAVVNRLFDAMRARDTAAIRDMMHPQMRIFVPAEQQGRMHVVVRTVDEFIAQVAGSTERLDERAIRPVARVDGDMASVWTYYEFVLGSTFSHCGTDAFHFARSDRGWIITALSYTVRREHCTR